MIKVMKNTLEYLKGNFYILVFILLAIFPKINIIDIPGIHIGIRIEDLIILGYTIFIIVKLIKDKNINNYSKTLKNIFLIFMIYFILCLVSTILGYIKGYISIYMGMFYLFRKLEYFMFIFIGYDFIKKSSNIETNKNKFIKTINFIVIIHFLICLLQMTGLIGSFDRSQYLSTLIQGRVCSTFNGAYEMTAFLLLLAPIYLYKIFSKKIDIFSSVIYLFMIGFMILISKSRTSLVIFLFLMLLMGIYYNKKYLKKILLTFTISVSLLLVMIFGFDLLDKLGLSRFTDVDIKEMVEATKYAWENKNFEKYLKTGQWYEPSSYYIDGTGNLVMAVECDLSYFVRISHWCQLLDGFTKSPIFGTGVSISQTAADGNYVRIISESGIFGFLLWGILQIYIIKCLNKNNEINANTKFGLITLFLGAIFIDVFEASKVMMSFYYILGFALAYNKKYKKINIDKLKNVVVINDFNYIEGGASKVAIKTAELLKEKVENVYYFCAVSKEQDKIDGVKYVTTNQTEALKTKNKLLGIINGIYNFKSKRKLRELLKTLNVNETIIHIHGWTKALSSSVFDISFYMGFKVVLTAHDYFTACPNGGYFNYNENKICKLKPQSFKCIKCNCDSRNYLFKIYRIIRQFVQNQIVQVNKKIEYVIGISDKNIEVLETTLNKDANVKKVLNPIDIEKIEERVKAEKNDTYLFIGRVAKEKGIDVFCKNISMLGLKGIVVGDGPELERLKCEYKDIEFTGWKSKLEIKVYMKKARVLIFPSLWYEGAPLTPLETMSYGIPCIVSNCSSAIEYINDKNGEIFDPYKNNDLKEKIDKINYNIKEYSENSYEYVKNLRDYSYLSELINFYKE